MAGQHDASRKAVDNCSGHCKYYARLRACMPLLPFVYISPLFLRELTFHLP
jgi:hypothetical protein